jgi:acetyl-CoA carboxylase biotin carboxylase subunit
VFEKVLIANRGEIAVRIIRACQELGIRTVAVYSDADQSALHVRIADEALCIGAAPANQSYLSVENLIRAAREAGAQAIHPGYGFLSESPEFAQAVVDSGLVFIGPAAQAIRTMGDKAAARALMDARGVPIVPGYQDSDDDASLRRAGEVIGYPLLVKAAAGGGGKAMRLVNAPDNLVDALGAARREAEHAFGETRLILEKYVPNARHVEFQVLADHYGAIVHLFERECSIQRRHQKIIEETPSPLLDSSLRREMGTAAIEAARAVGYQNAGTVEFIVDPSNRGFYFLEMNTRLQVEHPITEMTTGLDLVKWQIRVASGERFPYAQEQLAQRGHALECRVYAEDPANQFLPAVGSLLHVVEPDRPGIRIDSGVTPGDQVTVHYDPLLSKVISMAETRREAIHRMRVALGEYAILGVTTNLRFLQAVLDHPEFQAGRATTSFIDQYFHDWKDDEQVPANVLITAALSEMQPRKNAAVPDTAGSAGDPFSPWKSRSFTR